MFDIGHEDDYIIKLANEVRKVLGMVGVPKEKKLPASAHVPLESSLSPRKIKAIA
jgi:hypothetical protein